jgi:hypothetical protein
MNKHIPLRSHSPFHYVISHQRSNPLLSFAMKRVLSVTEKSIGRLLLPDACLLPA